MKTVRVSNETHEKLTEIGNKGQSYSDIIEKLIKEHKENGD